MIKVTSNKEIVKTVLEGLKHNKERESLTSNKTCNSY